MGRSTLNAAPPYVFVGPSLSPDIVRAALPSATVVPPARRGDLYKARDNGAAIILLIDGAFAHQLAVSPREVVDVIRDGAVLFGASSMGALRAVECRPLGMTGIGLIYRLFRRGVLDTDDEVAVMMRPEDAFGALTVALVNVRYATSTLVRAGRLDRAPAAAITSAARRLHFTERTWPAIMRRAGISDTDGHLQRACASIDLKEQDARQAVGYLRGLVNTGVLPPPAVTPAPRAVTAPRYPGIDRSFGEDPACLRLTLCRWVFGSGRYHQYIWALVVNEPEFRDVPADAPARSIQLRDRLPAVIARLVQDPVALADRLWNELELTGEIDAELLRWDACRSLAAAAVRRNLDVSAESLLRAFREVGRSHTQHGRRRDVRLLDTVPLEWREEAVRQIAQARRYAAQPPVPFRRPALMPV